MVQTSEEAKERIRDYIPKDDYALGQILPGMARLWRLTRIQGVFWR